MADETMIISKETLRRLANDIKMINRNPLHSHGIYYEHSETDILSGRAMIIGSEGTPYERGYYFFKLIFPQNYPHSPPTVTFLTNGSDYVRIHPNLYRNGKTCLSLLNTWHGQSATDRWTGCQTISSVLLTLSSILTNDPLQHEPGIRKDHPEFNIYTFIVEYINIKLAIIDILSENMLPTEFNELRTIALHDRKNNVDKIKKIFNEASAKFISQYNTNKCVLNTQIYKNQCYINYDTLSIRLDTTLDTAP